MTCNDLHIVSKCQVYLLLFSINSLCYVVDVSTVVLILPVFAIPYLCPPCLLCVCACASGGHVRVCVRACKRAWDDATAAGPHCWCSIQKSMPILP
jgi:hypothetical protein